MKFDIYNLISINRQFNIDLFEMLNFIWDKFNTNSKQRNLTIRDDKTGFYITFKKYKNGIELWSNEIEIDDSNFNIPFLTRIGETDNEEKI